MPDDENDAERKQETVDTVPPPSGESDVYGAKTQVGGLSAEALAMLRQVRDERPLPSASHDEATVPVFLDDDAPAGARPRVAAVIPSTHRPDAPVIEPFGAKTKAPPGATDPPPGTTMRPFLPGLPPLPAGNPHIGGIMPRLVAATPMASIPVTLGAPDDDPGASRPPAPPEIPTAPAFLPVRAPEPRSLQPLFESDDADEDPMARPSYAPLFGPASGQVAPATNIATPPGRRPRALTIVTVLTLLALVGVLVVEAGWLTGVIPRRGKPPQPPALNP